MFEQLSKQEGLPEDISFFYDKDRSFLFGGIRNASSGDFDWKDMESIARDWPFIKENGVSFVLLAWREHNEALAKFYSNTSRVRALEFLNVLFEDLGLVRGNALVAEGKVSQALLWTRIKKDARENIVDYITTYCGKYFDECDWIDAESYSKEHEEELSSLPVYKKKRIAWYFVPSLEIAPAGSKIHVRSLENEAGLLVVSGSDMIIMIGSQGEVYHMDKKKFDATYEATDEKLDIFSGMTLFLPEVSLVPSGEYVDIDELAKVCYPKPGNGIYAKALDRRANIFPTYSKDEYFAGKPGDYMAIRTDDLSDIYIIQREIFNYTYEKV